MPTEFTVRGSHSAFQPPERGTAHITLAFQGPALQPAYDRVVHDLEAVKASVQELHDPADGPVTWWSTQHVRTWAQRPWNKDGKQLPLVHHASVGVQVKFRDFGRLATWVGRLVSSAEGFRLDGVEWALTEARRVELERTVRVRAVQEAARRAQEYADALGLGTVRPVAVADAGMLSQGISPMGGGGPAAYMRMAAKESGGGAELELAPEDIEVSAEVDARFVAE
ncbi:SIMPL domain-containing protein [Nocardioides sp. QY071]|uniref:SIMPL domain-containing protein n=1 Tax=Nocardioides sp. QY071 TaxID=3044187 RepID=UPI00249C7FBB|nr:SIMPL domain-containing protein [Nocardioides sp. QY071]WGY03114.1 SIMPL domain-containing protein [Nocardioides sp. QY071]